MKKYSLLISIILFSSALFGQMPGMMGGGGGAMPGVGRLYGNLVDSTGKGIGSASVMLLHNKFDCSSKRDKEVLLKGMITQANGDFNFEELPVFRPLKLKITASGHKPVEQTVTIQPKMDAKMAAPPRAQAPGQMPDLSAMASA